MNQRQLLRRSIRLPVSFDRCIPGIAADFSSGGFRAEVSVPLAPGSRVIGYFLVGQSEVEFQGTVTWNRLGDPDTSFSTLVGVRFDALPRQLQVMLGAKRPHAAAA